MKATELMGYLTYVSEDIDLVVLDREEYDRLKKKACFYDKLQKFFKNHLTEAQQCGIITSK